MLDDYESICKEMVEATRDNDVKRINEIQEKVRKFQDKYSDFEEKDMTPQQKERFKEITTEMIGAAMENAMQDTGYTSGTAD